MRHGVVGRRRAGACRDLGLVAACWAACGAPAGCRRRADLAALTASFATKLAFGRRHDPPCRQRRFTGSRIQRRPGPLVGFNLATPPYYPFPNARGFSQCAAGNASKNVGAPRRLGVPRSFGRGKRGRLGKAARELRFSNGSSSRPPVEPFASRPAAACSGSSKATARVVSSSRRRRPLRTRSVLAFGPAREHPTAAAPRTPCGEPFFGEHPRNRHFAPLANEDRRRGVGREHPRPPPHPLPRRLSAGGWTRASPTQRTAPRNCLPPPPKPSSACLASTATAPRAEPCRAGIRRRPDPEPAPGRRAVPHRSCRLCSPSSGTVARPAPARQRVRAAERRLTSIPLVTLVDANQRRRAVDLGGPKKRGHRTPPRRPLRKRVFRITQDAVLPFPPGPQLTPPLFAPHSAVAAGPAAHRLQGPARSRAGANRGGGTSGLPLLGRTPMQLPHRGRPTAPSAPYAATTWLDSKTLAPGTVVKVARRRSQRPEPGVTPPDLLVRAGHRSALDADAERGRCIAR